MKKYLSTDNILLLLTILTGGFLRFYQFASLPYSFDEFSALSRTHFSTFRQLIEQGVVLTDTHPAGIQVFLFYWVKLFGYSEQIVKLPFILAGIGSIYLIHKIAGSWFNSTVALLSAMTLAFLQYSIMYSQFARPYASGLFFGLLMTWYWYKSFVYNDKFNIRDVTFYVLASALCAYNHHFTLFLIGLLWICGLPFLSIKKLKIYALAGLSVFVLYIPHLKIFFAQLAKGGVEEWLAKPTPGFFLEYFRYIFHFNLAFISLAALLIVLSFIWISPSWRKEMKFRWLMLALVAITWLTAYFYSEYRSAVLQYSVLIFTFPFLMMLMFSFFKNLASGWKIAFFLIFGFFSIYTLIVDRQHYRLMYQSGYREVLMKADSVEKLKGNQNVAILLDQPKHIQDYYLDKLKLNALKFTSIDDLSSYSALEDFVAGQTADYFVLGWNNPKELEVLSIVEKYYPVVLEHSCYYISDFYVLARNEQMGNALPEVLYSWDSDEEIPAYGKAIEGWQEYYNLFDENLDGLIKHPNERIAIGLDLVVDSLCSDNILVCEFYTDDRLIFWQTANFIDFIRPDRKEMSLFKVLKLADLQIDPGTTRLKIYLWNKSQQYFVLKHFQLEVMKGNPVIYGLYQEIMSQEKTIIFEK